MSKDKLTVKFVAAAKEPGKHGDGAGLYLVVDSPETKRWLFMYKIAGKRREMGLGSASVVGLAEARDLRDAAKRLLHEGRDPIEVRKAEIAAAEAASVVPFFGAFAVLVADGLDVKRERTRALWKASTGPKNTPLLQGLRVNEVATQHVIDTLAPIWKTFPIKAKKLRQKIEHILNVARALGYMGPLDQPYQNPAQWDGHLKLLLPKRVHKVKHYTALPYDEIGAFMADLSGRPGVSARALEFMILTVPRGHEVRHMRVKNVDLDQLLWRIPDEDQKSDREYLLPLTARPAAILREQLAALGPNPDPEAVVFPSWVPGARQGLELSRQSLGEVLTRMDFDGRATPHGFRSTFRDWAGDCTGFAREVIEHCLSHAVGDEVELAYRRSDALAKRREVLEAWATRCADVKADRVVAFKSRAA